MALKLATDASGIPGAAPCWNVPGKQHVPEIAPTTLVGGLGNFYSGTAGAAAPADSFYHAHGGNNRKGYVEGRRHYQAVPTHVQREPQVVAARAESGYHLRVAGTDGEFRRHSREVAPKVKSDRPEGRRKLEPGEAKYPVDRRRHVGQPVTAVYAPEPSMPRLFRPQQQFAVREDATEVALERIMQRKQRAPNDRDERIQARAIKSRVELDWEYAHQTVDTPTFQRFMKTVAPPAAETSVQRRMRATLRTQAAERQAELDLVRGLDNWDPTATPSGEEDAK